MKGKALRTFARRFRFGPLSEPGGLDSDLSSATEGTRGASGGGELGPGAGSDGCCCTGGRGSIESEEDYINVEM